MIIYCHLAKRIFLTSIVVVFFSSLVIMSEKLSWAVELAASGKIPPSLTLKLVLIQFPLIMNLILPLSLMLSMMLVYGTFFSNNEFTALKASGFSSQSLLKYSLSYGVITALVSFFFIFWLRPTLMAEQIKLMHTKNIETFMKTLKPGQFESLEYKGGIIYAEKINTNHTFSENIFFAEKAKNTNNWSIGWIDKAHFTKNSDVHNLRLKHGRLYQGIPGQGNFKLYAFNDLSKPSNNKQYIAKKDVRTQNFNALWQGISTDPEKASEFYWRLSIPVMILIISIIATGFCKNTPRSDKFAQLFPAGVVFFVYAHTINMSRKWTMHEQIPIWLGNWWLHISMLALGIYLFRKNHI